MATIWTTGAAFVLAAIVLGGSTASGVAAQENETETLRKRVQALEARQRALEAEVQELKRLLAVRQPSSLTGAPAQAGAPRTFNVSGAPFKGSRSAPVTLIEFSDYACGFCGRHARDTLPLIDKQYVQTGKVRYVFRSFPNEATHKLALKAHEAAACAGEQGQYWPMHDRLFAKPGALAPAMLMGHGQALGLGSSFEQCMASSKFREAIRQELAAGRALGLTATPTFLLGVAGSSPDQPKIVQTIRGAKPFAVFKAAIDQLLMP